MFIRILGCIFVLASVTPASANDELRLLVESMGYNPNRIFTQPTAGLLPGDVVVLSGTYKGNYPLTVADTHGTREAPIVFLAMPGEEVILDGLVASLETRDSSNIVFDGLTLTNSQDMTGQGARLTQSSDITLRNIHSTGHAFGLWGMQGLTNILVENCEFHANSSSGVNFGAGIDPNDGLTIRNCHIYNNGGDGFQHAGYVSNLLFENNTIHSNSGAGISLLNGVCDSLVSHNLVFNNSRDGILLRNTSTPYVEPGMQNDNIISDNIVWVGRFSWNDCQPTPEHQAAICLQDLPQTGICQNLIHDNIFVTWAGAGISFSDTQLSQENSFVGNVLFRQMSDEWIFAIGDEWFSIDDLNCLANCQNNLCTWPGFKDVSIHYYNTPHLFNFDVPEPHFAGLAIMKLGMLLIRPKRRS